MAVLHTVVLAASVSFSAAITACAQAADASRWDGDRRAAVRLIAGTALSEQNARFMRGGIQIKLGPTWKMYWRYPGDAGIPPRFDFTASENVKAVAILWPAPQRFSQDGFNLIVYRGEVTLPLRLTPVDQRKPATLRLKLDYGICETLCILAEAKSELTLSGKASTHDGVLAAAEARVPKPVVLGEGPKVAIRAIRREIGPRLPRIVVDVVAPATSSVDLFVEGPTPDWALPLPGLIFTEAGLRRFSFDVDGVPPGIDTKGAVLKFTAVAGEDAIEVLAPLD